MKNLETKKQWAVLHMCFGVGSLFVALNLLVESLEFNGCPTASGVVAAVESRGDGIATKKRTFARVRYTDATGTVRHASLNERMRIGRRVQVAYQKNDPTKIRNLDRALSSDQILLFVGISGLVTLLSIACLLWPAGTPIANRRPVEANADGRAISGRSGQHRFRLVAVALVFGLGGFAFHQNAYKTVKTTTLAEVVRSSDVGLNRPGLAVRYEDRNGTVRHTALDTNSKHKPGDRISFQYQEKSAASRNRLCARPWLYVAFLAVCGMVALVVIALKSMGSEQPVGSAAE